MSAVSVMGEVLRSFREEGAGGAGDAMVPVTPPPPAIGEPVGVADVAAAVGELTGEPPPADLVRVLAQRRAIRMFGPAPLDPRVLMGALAEGWAADRRHRPGEQRCCPLTPLVVAQNVAGLAPAVYRIDAGGTMLTPVMALTGLPDYEALTLQREFATAGAIVSVLGDLDAAERAHGGPGFRTLMTRAGALGYRTWLAAIGRGAVGSVFAGFLPAAVRAPLGCDGTSRHQLFALALGHPARAAAAAPASATSDSVGAGPAVRPVERG